MKKVFGLIAVIVLVLSSMAYAGGDQVCGDKAAGPAGSTGGGKVEQNQPPAD